ncbi:PilZ domain-containing protein [Geothrix sp. PMB-07]|uniref:PilZ domain-containing protein n=1 Tax=Geothrix sp. PMB-07 TaxID=3068640 RepID=UPI002740BABE|nr:PilZ domain-containing protein [Geothrix sp. PMB-07]WLT31092.1 PilZ domain-containing protein [Geothrix sp. PMB-07]
MTPSRSPKEGATLRGPILEEALQELCARKAFMLAATPYLSFHIRLLERRKEGLILKTSMTQDLAQQTLGHQDLKLRIPWGLGMVAGETRFLGFEQQPGARLLLLRTPNLLWEDDHRRSVRVDGQGRAVLSPDQSTLVRANLEDLSLHGARLLALEPLSEAFAPNHSLQLSLSLDQGPSFTCRALLVSQEGQSLGLAFDPPLGGLDLVGLEAWLKPRLDDLKRRWEDRVALRAQAEAAARPKAPPEGVLLVSREADLERQLREAWPSHLRLKSTPPALAPLKTAMEAPPQLVLLHWPGGGLQTRFLLKSLAATFPSNTPVMVLGTGLESAAGRELAQEIKASTYLEWNAAQALFFHRLVQGLLRRHWGSPGGPEPLTGG